MRALSFYYFLKEVYWMMSQNRYPTITEALCSAESTHVRDRPHRIAPSRPQRMLHGMLSAITVKIAPYLEAQSDSLSIAAGNSRESRLKIPSFSAVFHCLC